MEARSGAELRQAADRAVVVLERADAQVREQRFLTDDELRTLMQEQVSAEKAAIRAQQV